MIPGLPAEIDAPGRVEVRGEAVMLRSVWEAYNEAHPDRTLTNPRSGAAGTLMQKDPEAAADGQAAAALLRVRRRPRRRGDRSDRRGFEPAGQVRLRRRRRR